MQGYFPVSQLQGLFGGGGGVPQAPGANPPFLGGGAPQMTPLQGMGLRSPFLTERPAQALPTQGFAPSRTNAMGPNAMAMMGMAPNMPNMVGPTSALPESMQPQASQLKMWGMEDQLANPPGIAQNPGATGQQQPGAVGQDAWRRYYPGNQFDPYQAYVDPFNTLPTWAFRSAQNATGPGYWDVQSGDWAAGGG